MVNSFLFGLLKIITCRQLIGSVSRLLPRLLDGGGCVFTCSLGAKDYILLKEDIGRRDWTCLSFIFFYDKSRRRNFSLALRVSNAMSWRAEVNGFSWLISGGGGKVIFDTFWSSWLDRSSDTSWIYSFFNFRSLASLSFYFITESCFLQFGRDS